MPRLLVVDDEPNVLYSLQKSLRSDTLDVVTAKTGKEGIDRVIEVVPDAVIVDVRLPDMSGLDAYDRIRQIDPRLPVIVITAFARTETAIEAMRRGAFEYLLKPVDFRRLREVVAKALEVSRLSRVPAVISEEELTDSPADRIVGYALSMQEVYKAIGRVAPQDVTVLILGESGTGKELVARSIYHYSRRSQGPFLAINCAAIPDTLLESELFGHERGAFTGADQRRIGKFEQVSGGTVFLDEIGDMSAATQAQVLRLLQEQRFERMGGNETIQTDVRIIAATNKKLPELVEQRRFREDLFYRLNGFTIHLPPLRERREDVSLLVDHFLRVFNRELHKSVRSITPEARRILETHDWPGNVRELQGAVRFAMLHATGEVLTHDCLPESCRPPGPVAPALATSSADMLDVARYTRQLLASDHPDIYRHVSAAVDRAVLDEVLRHVKGNQLQAAELLGISRTTLRAKLRSLGMAVEKGVQSDNDGDKLEAKP
ncbi:MAG TPA: sigma-54 dependent transcriptional regulator [Pirellulales bacterium]|jgi:two-component system nitrogen regulation response regulator GlnG|nr:sigma-54 dependent transcriptional regulator [Pirellulales bacterium]